MGQHSQPIRRQTACGAGPRRRVNTSRVIVGRTDPASRRADPGGPRSKPAGISPAARRIAVMNRLTYRDAGLDLDLYEQSLAGMVPFLRRTHTPRVLDGFGGFASLFSLDYNLRLFAKNYRHPVLVTCTDGVGTKLKIASMVGKH